MCDLSIHLSSLSCMIPMWTATDVFFYETFLLIYETSSANYLLFCDNKNIYYMYTYNIRLSFLNLRRKGYILAVSKSFKALHICHTSICKLVQYNGNAMICDFLTSCRGGSRHFDKEGCQSGLLGKRRVRARSLFAIFFCRFYTWKWQNFPIKRCANPPAPNRSVTGLYSRAYKLTEWIRNRL